MSELSERIAAANKAVSGIGKPEGNYFLNAAKEGLAEGIGNIADVIPRAIQLGKAGVGMAMAPFTNDLPEVNTDFANSNTNALKSLLGVKQIEAPGPGSEIIGGAIRGATSSPIPMGGSGGLVSQAIKQALVGGAAGAGATAGGQAAEAIAPNNPVARAAGNLVGGVVGGVVLPSFGGVTGVVLRGKQMAEDAASNPALQNAAKTTAEKIVDRQVKDAVSGTPNAAANITDALRIKERMGPSFAPSVAEMADSPGLTEMQRRYTMTTPQMLNQEVARDQANAAAVRSFYENTAPDATSPHNVRSALNREMAGRTASLEAEATGNAAKLPVADQIGIGTRASEIANAEKSAARPAIRAAYEDAFDAAGGAKIDLSPVVAKVEEILGTTLNKVKPESAPATVAKIKQLIAGEGKSPEELEYLGSILGGNIQNANAKGAVSLRDLDEIRKAINADTTSAMRSSDPSAAMRLRNLSQVHNTIDEAIALSNIPDAAKSLYANAIQKYRNEFVPRFKEGANAQMFKDTALNEPRILADKFTTAYFAPDQSGGLTKSLQFKQLFGANAEAKALTKDGILDVYRQAVVNPQTGAVNPAAHERFMRDYGRTLASYQSAGVNALDDIRAVGTEAARISGLQSKLSDLSMSLKFDTVDDLVNAALKSPKIMGNTLQAIGSDNRATLQRVLMDRAWESGTGAGMQKYLEDNAKTLRMALTPQHLADMTDISKALAITERAPIRGTLQAGGPDILKNATGVSMATVWSQYRATAGGRQGPATAVFNLAAPVMTRLSQQNFNDVMQKALHDPQTAKDLRNFLMATSSNAGNATATTLLNRIARTGKMAAGIVWDYKGNAAKLLLGTENYQTNAARALPAIANTVEQQ